MKLRTLAGLVGCLFLSWAAPAHADVVSDWNAITLADVSGSPTVTAGRAGPPGLLDIALVDAAAHDAVKAIEGPPRASCGMERCCS